MKILIDSSVFLTDPRLRGCLGIILEAAQSGHQLYVPKVVVQEVVTKCRTELHEAGKHIQQQLKRVARWSETKVPCPLTDAKVDALAQDYDRFVNRCLSEAGVHVVGYPEITHEELVSGYFLGLQPPFR